MSETRGSASPALPPVRRRGVVGYTAGVFDMFHIGHLRLLQAARSRCDYLVVGVTTDELALDAKGQLPVVPLLERIAIVSGMGCVDLAVPQLSTDKKLAWQTFMFDRLFVGDTHRGTPQWDATEAEARRLGVELEYLPSTYERSGRLLERGLQDLVAD